MSAAELETRLAHATGAPAGQSAGGPYARACAEVPREGWAAAATAVRDDPALRLTFFDWLTGVDDGHAGFSIVAHLWSPELRHGALLRTALPRDDARLASLVGVYAGASWHERETHEMFGVQFDGHPNLVKLLLPDEFEGHPLRKDFVLAARVAKSWPGAKEPGENDSGAPSRRRVRPPGVPDPSDWGPTAGQEPPAEPAARPRRASRAAPGGEG